MPKRAEDHAVCQTANAETRGKRDCAKNDAEVVCYGGKCGHGEALLSVEDAHCRPTDTEQDRLDEQDTCQCHREGELIGLIGEARLDGVTHQRVRKQERYPRERGKHDHGSVEHAARESPRIVLFAAFEKADEHGDKRRAEGSGRDGEKQEVRQAEGGNVGIEIGTGAKLAGNDDITQQPKPPVCYEQQPDTRRRPPHGSLRLPLCRSGTRARWRRCIREIGG